MLGHMLPIPHTRVVCYRPHRLPPFCGSPHGLDRLLAHSPTQTASVQICDHSCMLAAEERTPSNPIAEDSQACKDLYDLTLEVVAQKAPDIRGLAIPEPQQPASIH